MTLSQKLHILCARSLKNLPVKMLYCDTFNIERGIGVSLCPYWKTSDYLEVPKILVLVKMGHYLVQMLIF